MQHWLKQSFLGKEVETVTPTPRQGSTLCSELAKQQRSIKYGGEGGQDSHRPEFSPGAWHPLPSELPRWNFHYQHHFSAVQMMSAHIGCQGPSLALTTTSISFDLCLPH